MTDVDKILRYLALELRERREEHGYSRTQAIHVIEERTGLAVGDRTLGAWEHSIREMTIKRYLQVAAAYGASPPLMLASAIRRADNACCRECGR